jgi:uncharacterized protein
MIRSWAVAAALAALALPGAALGGERDAVRSDPPLALRPQASMEEIGIQSHDVRLNGLMYLPAGPGTHPLVIFLHGYPGNERNLDLAQAVRRAGYNALFLDYRGVFGTGGTFSFEHAREDAAAVLAWARTPESVAKYRIDPARIAVVGHSFAGWLALTTVAQQPAQVCVAAIAAWNPGWVASRFAQHPEELADVLGYYRQTTDPVSGPIHANADDLVREMSAHAQEWNYVTHAAALKDHALLLVAGTRDTLDEGIERESELLGAIRNAGGKRARIVSFADDETFSSFRLALADALIAWLGTDCAASQGGKRP